MQDLFGKLIDGLLELIAQIFWAILSSPFRYLSRFPQGRRCVCQTLLWTGGTLMVVGGVLWYRENEWANCFLITGTAIFLVGYLMVLTGAAIIREIDEEAKRAAAEVASLDTAAKLGVPELVEGGEPVKREGRV